MIKNVVATLPEYIKIKCGTKGETVVSAEGKKFPLPKKLDHYFLATTERDTEGNLVVDTNLMETLKESGQAIVNKDGNLTGIPIRLLYNSIDLNFQTRYSAYVGGKCVCSGNGEEAQTRDGRTKKCPCEQLDPLYKGKDKCKVNGKLLCVIEGAEMVGACAVLRTTSINTVKSILGSLAFIKTAAGGMLAFLPLHLILKPKTVTIPTTGQLTTVYVSSIVFRGSILELQRQALGMAKEKATYLLEMDQVEESARVLLEQSVESEQEQLEIQQEFYPDAVEAEVIPEKQPAEQEPEPEAKPEPKPKPKPAPKPSAKQKPPVEPEPEPEKSEEPDTEPPAEQTPITKDQKRQIVALKKENKITDPAVWAKLLEPFGVKTANDLTETSANEFIEALQKNPF